MKEKIPLGPIVEFEVQEVTKAEAIAEAFRCLERAQGCLLLAGLDSLADELWTTMFGWDTRLGTSHGGGYKEPSLPERDEEPAP